MKIFHVTLKNISSKTFWNCVLGMFVITFIVYGKSISNKYSMDDEYIMVNNKQIHKGVKAIPEIFRSTYALDNKKSSYEYRPIVKVTYAIEYSLFGEKPGISHFINVLSYAILVSFLFFMMLKLFETHHYLFSLTVAFIFLIHPLHSEVVLSLKNRDELLSLMGCLLSLFFYLKYADTGKWANLTWGAVFMLFAMLSKKDAMTFYAVIPLTLYFFRNLPLKRYALIAVSYMPTAIMYVMAARSVKEKTLRVMLLWENPLFIHSSLVQRIPTGIYTFWFYIKMFVFPHPLISYYGYNQVPVMDYSDLFIWIILAAGLGLLFFVFKNFRSKPVLIYGMLYFAVTISMFTNIVKPVVGIVGERFAFIPSVGLCIVSAWLIFKLFKIPFDNLSMKLSGVKNSFFISVIILGAIFGGMSFARNAAWKDSYTLYKTDVEHAPESAHTHALLAASAITNMRTLPHLSDREKQAYLREAEQHYLESLRIFPDYTTSHNNLGMIYYTYLNKNEEAIGHFEKAITLDTAYSEAYFNLAGCYMALKQYDNAEKYYLKAIALNPRMVASYVSLSNIYISRKQTEKVLALNEDAIAKGIKSDAIYINIGNVYFMNGDTLKAVPYLETAIKYNSNNKGVNAFLANYYQLKGNRDKADFYHNLFLSSQ